MQISTFHANKSILKIIKQSKEKQCVENNYCHNTYNGNTLKSNN